MRETEGDGRMRHLHNSCAGWLDIRCKVGLQGEQVHEQLVHLRYVLHAGGTNGDVHGALKRDVDTDQSR